MGKSCLWINVAEDLAPSNEIMFYIHYGSFMQIQEVRYFAYACCLECPRTIQTSIKKKNLQVKCAITWSLSVTKHINIDHGNIQTKKLFDIFILHNSNMLSTMEVTTVFPYGQRSLAITNGTQTLFIILSKKKHINKFIWPCFVIKVKPF